MLDMLKKTLYAGLGATVISAERLQAKLDELVRKGRISSQEAQEMTDKIMAEGRKEYEEGTRRVSDMLNDMLRRANFARQKDLEALAVRVTELERLHAQGPNTAGPQAAAPGSVPPPQPTVPPLDTDKGQPEMP